MATYKKNNYRPHRGKKNEEVEVQEAEPQHFESSTVEAFEVLDQEVSKTEAWVEKHKNTVFGVLGVAMVFALGFMLYQHFVGDPKQKEASNELSYPLLVFEKALNEVNLVKRDSLLNASLSGTNGRYGFVEIAKNYSSTKAANIANYSAGMAYLHLGKYKEAITHLEAFSSSDQILSSLALGNIGDAFAHIKQPKDALEYYERAFKKGNNSYSTPIYLYKAGVVAMSDAIKDYGKAEKYFKQIKENYPKSEEARTIDIYLSQVKTLKEQK